MENGGIDARVLWALLIAVDKDCLGEPVVDYGGLLDGLEAAELLALIEKAQERLKEIECIETAEPVDLFIDKRFVIRMGGADGSILALRPLVKTLFILFLKHPEGIILKQRDYYREELEKIYGVISPNTDRDDVRARVARLVDLQDNSFSEKASVLNARLEELLPAGVASDYQIQGFNGCPRKIRLNPLLVHWE